MKFDDLIQMAVTFALLSLIALGGVTAILPEIHRSVVDVNGWMSSSAFASLFAIAQVAPGPNIMLISLVGWQVAGLPGLLVATLAFLLPSGIIAIATGNLLARYHDSRGMAVVKAGLVPLAAGLFTASGVVMCRAADSDVLGWALSVGGVAFALRTSRNPLWALLTGAGVGLLAAVLTAA